MKSILYSIIVFGLLMESSCLKQKAETPESKSNYDPALSVNFNLSQLNKINPTEGAPVLIDSDWIIACIVRADDESGNSFNQLVLEDSTGGIALLLNENSLYTRYPIGRKLYLKVKGLYLGNYHGSLQLGGVPAPDNSGVLQVSDIPAKYFLQFIVPANILASMPPVSVSIEELYKPRTDLVNRLVRIEDVEIVNPNYDNIYSDPAVATSIKLQNCRGINIVLRSSNYASFQAFPTPSGKGSITAIYTLYNGAGQLIIRDTNDLNMNGVRCDGSVVQPARLVSVDSVRKTYNGKDTILGNIKIRAVVSSDAVHKNFGIGNIVLQQNSKGLTAYFGSSGVDLPDLGDSIELYLAGATLTQYNGVLELKNIKTNKVTMLAHNTAIVPVTLTLAALNANFKQYESVLVRIVNAKITTTGSYSGNNTLSDGTGTITLYTSSNASFANDAVPGITKTIQGIATPYNSTNELKIRNTQTDVY